MKTQLVIAIKRKSNQRGFGVNLTYNNRLTEGMEIQFTNTYKQKAFLAPSELLYIFCHVRSMLLCIWFLKGRPGVLSPKRDSVTQEGKSLDYCQRHIPYFHDIFFQEILAESPAFYSAYPDSNMIQGLK